MSINAINKFPLKVFNMVWGDTRFSVRESEALSGRVTTVACDAFPVQTQSVMKDRIIQCIRDYSVSLLVYLRIFSQQNLDTSSHSLLEGLDFEDIQRLMNDWHIIKDDLSPEDIHLLMGDWEIIGEDEKTQEKRQREFLDLRENICGVLNEIRSGRFTDGFFKRFYAMSDRISAYNAEYSETPIIGNNFIRLVFNMLLERDQFTVPHEMDPSLNQDATINQGVEPFVEEWVQNYSGTKMVANAFGRSKVWAFDNPVVLEDESDDAVKAAQFHRTVSDFYRENVSNPEELVHALMVRMSTEYSAVNIFAQLSSLDQAGYLLVPKPTEHCGFYFGFESGNVIGSQKTQYMKLDCSGNEDPQLFEIIRTISLDPNNVSETWEEVVTIRK